MVATLDMKETQTLIRQLVTDFQSPVPEGLIMQGTGFLNPEERVEIYRRDFISRFIEVLGEAFPNLKILLGENEFENLIFRYVKHHPSRHFDLGRLGENLPQFLASDEWVSQAPFLPDLARAEWDINCAFHQPVHPPVDLSSLANWDEEVWSMSRFEFQPSLVLLSSPWPLSVLLHVKEMKEEEFDPEIIRKGDPVHLLIAQDKDSRVDWRTLDEQEFHCLQALRIGRTLGSICAEFQLETEAERAQVWFTEWIERGLVTRICS